jgi:cyclopropane-fatty-acyl-phospholipid synthase
MQVFKPSFYQYLSDMLRFNSEAAEILTLAADDPRRVVTTGQYLRDHAYSQAFCTNYLLPMMAARWSASIEDVLQFPAEQLIGFLCNHKMLQLFERPQVSCPLNVNILDILLISTVLIAAPFHSGRQLLVDRKLTRRRCSKSWVIEPTCRHPLLPLKKVATDGQVGYELFSSDDKSIGVFDDLIFACHPPTAREILSEGNVIDDEALDMLQKIEYADNAIYVPFRP